MAADTEYHRWTNALDGRVVLMFKCCRCGAHSPVYHLPPDSHDEQNAKAKAFSSQHEKCESPLGGSLAAIARTMKRAWGTGTRPRS